MGVAGQWERRVGGLKPLSQDQEIACARGAAWTEPLEATLCPGRSCTEGPVRPQVYRLSRSLM